MDTGQNSRRGSKRGSGRHSLDTPALVDSTSVSAENSNNSSSNGQKTAPPPPYTPDDETRRGSQLLENCKNADKPVVPSITEPYSVPKDVSEGLPNPVFSNTENPDSVDDSQSTNVASVVAKDTLPATCYPTQTTVVGNRSFTSLNSYEQQYASHTALYSKDKRSDSFDAESGKPCGSTKDNASSKKNGKEKPEYKGLKRYMGLMLTLSASFCFSVVVLFVKVLKDYGFDAYGASFWRYTGTVIPTIPLLFFYECGPGTKKQESVFASVWPVWENGNWKTWIGLLSRGIIGSTSVILRYCALQYLTIGDTSVITYSTPVLVTVLAHFCLGERCGVFPIIIAFVTLCGVIIVIKPPILTGATEFDTNTLIGTGFACGSLLCSALIVIITRKIREVHFTVMTLVFGIIGVAQALLLTYFLGHFNLPTELWDSVFTAGVAGLSFIGQMSIVLALKFEQAGPVALIRSCDVLFGFLFQYIFLHVSPDIFSAVGAVIVLTGVLSIGFRKWLNALPKEDSRRKRWWFILK